MIDVAVAGASGLVGRKLLELLDGHPAFRLVARLGPARRGLDPLDAAGGAAVVFSALPAAVAREWEPRWVGEGRWVFSNSGAYELGGRVPVIPEVNPADLPPRDRPALVLSPNCSAHGLALSLAPLRRLGLDRVIVTTLQALSGAGKKGVPELEGGDNLLPHILGEERRLEQETAAMLGGGVVLSAQCNRVLVRDGHTLSVSVGFRAPVEAGAILDAWARFPARRLPSAPDPPLVYLDDPARPQPLLDRDAQRGMQVSLGRLRSCPVLGWRYVALVHNLVRGAAGAALLNAEEVLLGGPDDGPGPSGW